MSDPQEYRLQRNGDAPLVFRGQSIASSSTYLAGGQDHNRWHTLAIYRTQAGRYVVSIEYRTRWQGEQGRCDVIALGGELAEVAALLRAYDGVIPEGIGYPPDGRYADRQLRVEQSLRSRWDAMVGNVLDEIGAADRIE